MLRDKLAHKSHNAPNKYPTVQHFVSEMCTHARKCLLQNAALWDGEQVHYGIFEIGQVPVPCSYIEPGLTEPAHGLAPEDARPSAFTVMT